MLPTIFLIIITLLVQVRLWLCINFKVAFSVSMKNNKGFSKGRFRARMTGSEGVDCFLSE
jgi:hypothetical protein